MYIHIQGSNEHVSTHTLFLTEISLNLDINHLRDAPVGKKKKTESHDGRQKNVHLPIFTKGTAVAGNISIDSSSYQRLNALVTL